MDCMQATVKRIVLVLACIDLLRRFSRQMPDIFLGEN